MKGTHVREWVSQHRFDPRVATLVTTALLALLIDTVGTWALTAVGGASVRPLALLVVLATVSVGVIARWGLSVGMLLSGFIVGGWSGGVVSAIAVFTAVVVCGQLQPASCEDTEWYRWLLSYSFVALVATLTLTATTAWLADAFGTVAFSVVVGRSVAANLPLALLAAPVAWVLPDRGTWSHESMSTGVSPRVRLLAVGILSIWVVGGYVGSFLYRAAATVPVETFDRRLGSAAETIVILGGPQGRYAVFFLGVMALVALFASFRYGQSHQ